MNLADRVVYGRIFDISKGCVEDGPGLRDVVFFKGCNLKCPWCHNIEGISFEPEIAYNIKKCISCMRCRTACKREWKFETEGEWRAGCTGCGKCADVCPAGARRLAGVRYSPDMVLDEIKNDLDYIKDTGGGVTISGGEPLAQSEFFFCLAERLKREGINVALETSGFWPEKYVERVIESVDLVIFDIKHTDPVKFREATGHDNGTILENLKRLIALDKSKVTVTITAVPGFNAGKSDIKEILLWVGSIREGVQVSINPFHRMAVAKERLFDKVYPYRDIDPPTE